MMQLDEAFVGRCLSLLERPAVLVAHRFGLPSGGGMGGAFSACGPGGGRAWLVARLTWMRPSGRRAVPPQLHGWVKVPQAFLPFPAQVLAPTDAPGRQFSGARPRAGCRLARRFCDPWTNPPLRCEAPGLKAGPACSPGWPIVFRRIEDNHALWQPRIQRPGHGPGSPAGPQSRGHLR